MQGDIELVLAERAVAVELTQSSVFFGLVTQLAAAEYPLKPDVLRRWGVVCRTLMVPLTITLANSCSAAQLNQCDVSVPLRNVLQVAIADSLELSTHLEQGKSPDGGLGAIKQMSRLADLMELGLGYTSRPIDFSLTLMLKESPT